MAISYPLSFPSGAAGIERFSLTAMQAVATLRSPFTFATTTYVHPGQAWSAEVSLAPCKSDRAEPWIAFLTALKGPQGTFLMGDPWKTTPLGVATGSPKVNGSNAARSSTLAIKGWTTGVTNILKAGDYLQVGQRLYKVLQNVNSDGSGNCTVDIFPTLREALSDNTTIITSAPKGLFRLASNETSLYEIDKERFYTISFSAVEAI